MFIFQVTSGYYFHHMASRLGMNNTSGLQIFGKPYDAHNNVAYIMTKL